MSEYSWPLVAIVSASGVETVRAALASVTGLTGDLTESFTAKLSATGQEPATHYGACARARAATRMALLAAAGSLPGLTVYDGYALGAESLEALWAEALQTAGLQRIQPTIP